MRGKSLSEWSEPSTGLVKDRYHPSDTERAGNFDLPAMGELLLGGLTTSGSWLHGERMLPIVAHMVGRSSRAIDPNRDTGTRVVTGRQTTSQAERQWTAVTWTGSTVSPASYRALRRKHSPACYIATAWADWMGQQTDRAYKLATTISFGRLRLAYRRFVEPILSTPIAAPGISAFLCQFGGKIALPAPPNTYSIRI